MSTFSSRRCSAGPKVFFVFAGVVLVLAVSFWIFVSNRDLLLFAGEVVLLLVLLFVFGTVEGSGWYELTPVPVR